MKIEAGKWYKLRNGDKVFVVYIRTDEAVRNYPVIGYIEGKLGAWSWCLDGRLYPGEEVSMMDIIEEWKENPLKRFSDEELMAELLCRHELEYGQHHVWDGADSHFAGRIVGRGKTVRRAAKSA